MLNFCQFVPVLVLAPWAGSAADRFDKRRLLLGTQVGATVLSAALALLAWTHHAGTAVVIGFALALGVTSAYSAPASQALIGWLAPPQELPSAVALNSMTFNLARAIGPALAAVSVRSLGIPASFAINAGSYVLLALALLVIRPRAQRRQPRAATRLRDSRRSAPTSNRIQRVP